MESNLIVLIQQLESLTYTNDFHSQSCVYSIIQHIEYRKGKRVIFLTLVWKLKTVTRRQTAAVMPRHNTTDLVL